MKLLESLRELRDELASWGTSDLDWAVTKLDAIIRAEEERGNAGDAALGEPDMRLPEGRTCSDCAHYQGCVRLFGCKPGNTECDFSPSRYHDRFYTHPAEDGLRERIADEFARHDLTSDKWFRSGGLIDCILALSATPAPARQGDQTEALARIVFNSDGEEIGRTSAKHLMHGLRADYDELIAYAANLPVPRTAEEETVLRGIVETLVEYEAGDEIPRQLLDAARAALKRGKP